MADIEWLLEQIETGPEGPAVGAFFDFDGTLIDGYSATAFFQERLKKGDIGVKELVATLAETVNIERRGHDVDELMRIGVGAQAGKSFDELERWSKKVFAKKIAGKLYPDARVLIDAHKRMGHTVVVASSATEPQIKPTADDLGVRYIVCTRMADDGGVLTGALDGPIMWGQGKADGVRKFARSHKIRLKDSYAYSNGAEDVPMLELVGHPCALNADPELTAVAKQHGWPVTSLNKPPSTTPADVVRSAAAIGVFAGSVGAAATLGLLNGSRRMGANIAASAGSDLGLAAAGVRLNIVGEENAWVERPAVFLFNHQSQLDVFVLGAVLRRDFTGVAKKELEYSPFFGPIGYLADVAYIDRGNNQKAQHQLEPVVDMLRSGRSIAIAPEGTRSPTSRLLPFKKGPFHMAMQAHVPIVPIVMRNCGEIMAAHSMVIHPGTVDVAVLPPVSTKGWTKENLDEHVKEVRDMYLQTLADWPTSL